MISKSSNLIAIFQKTIINLEKENTITLPYIQMSTSPLVAEE